MINEDLLSGDDVVVLHFSLKHIFINFIKVHGFINSILLVVQLNNIIMWPVTKSKRDEYFWDKEKGD